ncbi:unnamed protein product [Medioppia subpectinata]|uniref:Uncharacterized protein n=1 Tax=Medioppia subpectinata TaxID=1979941 RepID=A0A7R9LWM0_9ACAR|nr:unnamed protein product [Medioppia subpectinata]CAG2122289.1 unnamed protein product [Medioppia subpectinata]
MGDIDKDTHITVEVGLNHEELNFCVDNATNVQNISQLLRYSNYLFNSQSYTASTGSEAGGPVYKGTRARTKFSLSLNMYCEEIVDWTQKADEDERRQQLTKSRSSTTESVDDTPRRRTRRALSCIS